MAEERRRSKKSSGGGHGRGNSTPQRQRQHGSSNGGGGRERSKRENGNHPGRSDGTKSMATNGTTRSSRPRDASHNTRSRSRSKSRPKGRNGRDRSRPSENKPKQHRDEKNRSSRPKQSSKSRPQDDDRPGPRRQQSRSSKSNQTKANGNVKKQPSTKKLKNYASKAQKAIPASVRMISGSHDAQTSADISNISSQFQLPDPAGRSGGACTAALLQVLYQSYEDGRDDLSWVDVLRRMRDVLNDRGYEQIPQLTSSRMIDVDEPFVITPTDGSFSHKNNTQRAVLIGINYTGQRGELSGCHNDVHNVAKYLTSVQGFKPENVTILLDDGKERRPTKSAILSAYKRLVKESKAGDVVFCHYSGHGGRLPDDNGDEDDGYDETLIPVDFEKKGQIRDDDLLKVLVHPMPEGVTMTCLMDCCHSGTVLDLPYRFTADGDLMDVNEKVNFKGALWEGLVVGAVASAVTNALTPEPEMMILGGGPNAIHEYSDTGCCAIS